MTTSCSATTPNTYEGYVALPYWKTLHTLIEDLGVLTDSNAHLDKHEQELNASIDSLGESNTLSSIPIAHYVRLFEIGVKHCSDFGLRVGQSVTPGTYPVLGMTLLSCQNLLQVLEQVVRYESLNHELGSSNLTLTSEEATFSWTLNPLIFPEHTSQLCFHLVLSIFSGIVTFSPWLINQKIPIKRLCFTCSEPSNAHIYREFFDADIKFNQPSNAIVVSKHILSWDVLNGDATSFNALKSYADSLLDSKNQKQNIIHQLQKLLPEALRRQTFKVEELASQLNMSARTLQRKLKEHDQNYQAILDATRQKIAELYLSDTSLSMNEIAFLVGYQEQSSFNHAFKSWKGISPSAYRTQIMTDDFGSL